MEIKVFHNLDSIETFDRSSFPPNRIKNCCFIFFIREKSDWKIYHTMIAPIGKRFNININIIDVSTINNAIDSFGKFYSTLNIDGQKERIEQAIIDKICGENHLSFMSSHISLN